MAELSKMSFNCFIHIFYPIKSPENAWFNWLVVSNPLKNMKVSWDDDIPNWMNRHKILWFQTTNQLFIYYKLAMFYSYVSLPKGICNQ